MARQNELYLSVKDGVTDSFQRMMQSGGQFNKELEYIQRSMGNLDQKQSTLIRTQAQYKTAIEDANRAMKEARKEYSEFSTETNRNKFEQANENLARLKNSYSDVSSELGRVRREQRQLLDEQQRASNRVSEDGGVLGSLGEAGLTNLLGQSVTKAFNTGVSSAFGGAAGSAISTVMEQAVAGAAIGSIIPGIGTAIGAGVGAIGGAISAGTDYFASQDDAFRTARDEMVDSAWSEQEAGLARGIDTFAQRQMTQKSFTTLLGSEREAQEFNDILIQRDIMNPMSYDQMSDISRVLFSFRFSEDETLDMLDKVGDMGAAFGWDQSTMTGISQTLAQIRSFPTFNTRQMQTLTKHSIPVEQYLMEYYELEKEEVWEGISKGKFRGEDVFNVLSKAIGEDPRIVGAMDGQSETYLGILGQIEGARDNIESGYGEGYINTVHENLVEQDKYLEEHGDAMKQANYYIGQFQASLENNKEAISRSVQEAVMDGVVSADMESFDSASMDRLGALSVEYREAQAKEDGAEMGKILAEAQLIAEAEYNRTEGAQIELESRLQLTESATSLLVSNDQFWNANYRVGQEASKGIAAGILSNNPYDSVISQAEAISYGISGPRNDIPSAGLGVDTSGISESEKIAYGISSYDTPNSHAFGLPYVPYDNYPALLHRGEKVTTAVDARSEKENSGAPTIQIDMTGAKIGTVEEAEEIGNIVAGKLIEALELST